MNGVGNGDSIVAQSCEKSENGFKMSEVTPKLNSIISRSGLGEKVKIREPERVEKLINEIVSSGPSKLQVITDFDRTLSCYYANGKSCSTSYGVISDSCLVPQHVKKLGMQLFNKYHPFENDVTISKEERIAKLAEWYHEKHENYLRANLQIQATDVAKVVKEAHLVLREASQDVLTKLNSAEVPLLVFSAGSGDTIREVLKLNQVDLPNTKIIANFMKFDESTRMLVGFTQPIIHPGNKNGTVLKDEPYFETLKGRPNALLLGDCIGDVEMANGMPNQDTVLKIGFLNFKIKEQLDTFMDMFDIVLIDDQTFHFVDALLNLILPKKQ